MRGQVKWVGETASTNTLLRREADAGALAEYYTICADYQTAGRGQVGNSWESERGKNLLLSTLLLPKAVDVSQQFFVSMGVSLAVQDAVRPLLAREGSQVWRGLKVKWPNDIYVGDKKLAGILIENRLDGRRVADTIVGLGLNVNQEVFYSDAPNPVSLKNLTGEENDLRELAESVTTHLEVRMSQLGQGGYSDILQEYVRGLYRGDGGYYPFEDSAGLFMGKILGVMPDGRLLIEDDKGHGRSYLFKEVEFVL